MAVVIVHKHHILITFKFETKYKNTRVRSRLCKFNQAIRKIVTDIACHIYTWKCMATVFHNISGNYNYYD